MIVTVGDPGVHGADIAGTQGTGTGPAGVLIISAGDMHSGNGAMFTIGLLSIIFARGILVCTIFTGSTLNVPGPAPKLHMSIAPPHTAIPIYSPPFARRSHVVSGAKAAIEAIASPVRERKGRCIPLPVSGAFHSPLMKEAAKELIQALESLGKGAWSHASFPIFSNVSARPETDCTSLKENLKKQMTSSVFWIGSMEGMWSFMQGAEKFFVECGPKGVLTKMVGAVLGEYAPAKAASSEDAPAWKAVGLGNSEQVEAFLKG